MDEHKDLIRHVDMAYKIANSWKEQKCGSYDEITDDIEKMRHIAEHFEKSENHYLREENALFPYLEKHGITGPPAAMWAEHETIREAKKNYRALFENVGLRDLNGFLDEVAELSDYLRTLLFEITFIGSNDQVRYFNRSQERLFVRTKASLGRKVHQCHPQKSLHLVNQIVDDFKSGKRDEADFWIELKGRFIYIRFFPVRDTQGNYLGAMEVVQDVTGIRKLEGEKRLL